MSIAEDVALVANITPIPHVGELANGLISKETHFPLSKRLLPAGWPHRMMKLWWRGLLAAQSFRHHVRHLAMANEHACLDFLIRRDIFPAMFFCPKSELFHAIRAVSSNAAHIGGYLYCVLKEPVT